MKRYFTQLLVTVTLLVALIVAFTRLIDPYGYWGEPIFGGFNDVKPFAEQHVLAVKHSQYARARYRTLLVGNSRTEVGFDPASSVWPQHMQPVYNFGLPAMTFTASVDAAIQAVTTHRPDTVIVGVEFVDFRVTKADWRAAATPQPLRERRYHTPVAELTAMLFSLDTLRHSVQTLAEPYKRYPATTTPQGYNALNDYHDIVANEGYAAVFAQRNREFIKRFQTQQRKIVWPGPGANPNWLALAKLVRVCRDHHIRLIFHTYPYHVDLLTIFDRTDLLGDLERWRSDLAGFARGAGIPLYDFIALNAQTTEPVPITGDKTSAMKYYWEAGHFRSSLGNMLIAEMVNGQPPKPAFGDLTGAVKTFEHGHPTIFKHITQSLAKP